MGEDLIDALPCKPTLTNQEVLKLPFRNCRTRTKQCCELLSRSALLEGMYRVYTRIGHMATRPQSGSKSNPHKAQIRVGSKPTSTCELRRADYTFERTRSVAGRK